MVLWVYIVSISIFLFVYFHFIEKHRCFVREGSKSYPNHVGVEFTHTFMEKITCHLYWGFTSWMVLFLVAAAAIYMYTKRMESSPATIVFAYLSLVLAWIFLGSFVVVGDGHDYLMGKYNK